MGTNFLKKSFEFVKDTIYKTTHKDAAKMLIWLGAAGFALSSLAQCFAIEINDKIDKKKKRFLLRQEAADGVVNIGLFLAITSSVWKLSDKILNKLGIVNIKDKNLLINDDLKQIVSGGRIVTTMIASVLACNVVTPFVRNLIAGKITACKDKQELKSKSLNINIANNQVNNSFINFDIFNKMIKPTNVTSKYIYPKNSGSLKI